MIAKEWQKLTKTQKQKYKEAAKRDKDRFASELTQLSKAQDDTLLYKMPKKPLTAYMFFVRQTRTQVAIQMPDIPPLDIMKEVGKIWQRQTETDLEKFKAMAKQDTVRYQEEMEKFIGMLNSMRDDCGTNSIPHQKGGTKDATGQDSNLHLARLHTQLTEEEKQPRSTTIKLTNNLPQKACRHTQRGEEHHQGEESPRTPTLKCNATGLKGETHVKEKGNFSQLAMQLVEEDPKANKCPVTHSKSASKVYMTPDKQQLARVSQRLFQSSSKQKLRGGGFSSHRKPKKPLSAYIFYSQEQRDRLKREHPHWSTREVMVQVSDQWRQIPRDKRHEYVNMASQDKRRFEEELKFLRTYSSAQLRQAAQIGDGEEAEYGGMRPKKLCFDNVTGKETETVARRGIFRSTQELKKDKETLNQERKALTLLAQSSHDQNFSSPEAQNLDVKNSANKQPHENIGKENSGNKPQKHIAIAQPFQKDLTMGGPPSLNMEYLNGFGHAYQGTLSPLQRENQADDYQEVELSPMLRPRERYQLN